MSDETNSANCPQEVCSLEAVLTAFSAPKVGNSAEWREGLVELARAELAALRARCEDLELMLRWILENSGSARSRLRSVLGQPIYDSGDIPLLADAARRTLKGKE